MGAERYVVIPAAGRSSRFAAGAKPLYELAGVAMLERVVALYVGLGITPVIVIGQDDGLLPLLDKLDVAFVRNDQALGDMLSSIKAGLAAISPMSGEIFIHPCDIPAVLPATVVRLGNALNASDLSAACPVFGEVTGHPLALKPGMRTQVLAHESDNGLRGILQDTGTSVKSVPVDDEGTVMDVDTVKQAREVEALLARRQAGPGCSLYLLRHGQVRQRIPRRFIGQQEIELDEVGRQQIRDMAEALRSVRFEAVYSSPLQRCLDTARAVVKGRGMAVETRNGLMEIALGDWEDMTVDMVRKRFPGEYERRGRNMADYRTPGGESFRDVQERALSVLDEIDRKHAGEVLIVAHGGVNRAVLCAMLGKNLSGIFDIAQDYCHLNRIRHDNGVWSVQSMNCEKPMFVFRD